MRKTSSGMTARALVTGLSVLAGGAASAQEAIVVASNSWVGIGTNTPQARLEVVGGEVRFPAGIGGGGFTHFNLIYDGKNYIRGTTLIADNGGSVGIGTAVPSSKLHVHGGDIRVSSGNFIDDGVTIIPPDYVFEPDYQLMPLSELAAYVEREKHLPSVPSAADIKSNGLNVSQFQMRLLEKVEELTLYAIAQETQARELRAALDGQQVLIQDLRRRLDELAAEQR